MEKLESEKFLQMEDMNWINHKHNVILLHCDGIELPKPHTRVFVWTMNL